MVEDKDWNPWLEKVVHPSEQLVDLFQSWDSATTKPRLKAWHRAKKWVSDIVRLPFTPPTGLGLRISDKDNAFNYLTEEMSKSVSFTDFLRSCMTQPSTPLSSESVATPQPISGTKNEEEIILENEKAPASDLTSTERVGKLCKLTWLGTECQTSDCSKVHI